MRNYFIIFFLFLTQAYTQVIITEQSEGKRPLVITRMDFKVKALGFLAETEIIMTFANPNNGDMIGNFYLPIPERSQVSSYALDVKGVLIDAVAIKKVRARQVFETITRRRVDPGLLEWTKGNNFKTRVYPIPGRGSRIIRVKILTEMKKTDKGFLYKYPLNFKDPTNILTLHVKGLHEEKPLVVTEEFTELNFTKEKDNSFQGIIKKFRVKPSSIELVFPDKQKEWQFVYEDKSKKLYYLWACEIKPLTLKRDIGKFITLFWDASHSRKTSDKSKELKVLEGICKELKDKTVINLIVFRDSFESVRSFEISDGNSEELRKYLSTVEYDGGTLIDSSMIFEESKAAEEIMIFSDGLSTLSNFKETKKFKQYITLFNSSNNLDELLFDRVLAKSRGRFINLNSKKVAESVLKFFSEEVQFDAKNQTYIQHYPRNNQNVSGLFVRSGVLGHSEEIETFTVNFKNAVKDNYNYDITRNDRQGGELVKTFFTLKKMESLLFEGDEKRVLDHGLKYHLSTPYTSMLVLESYWDYVRYNIEPPETMPKWREDFLSRPPGNQDNFQPSEKWVKRQTKYKWHSFLNWWKTDFKYPENFAWQKGIYFFPDSISAGLLEIVETKTSEGLDGGDLVGGLGSISESADAGGGEADPFAEDDPFAGDPLDNPAAEEKQVGEIETVTIVKKEWDESSKELREMKSSKDPYGVYLVLKKKYGHLPDFYLKSAKVLFSLKKVDEAKRVATTCAEVMGNNVSYLRKLAFALSEMKQHDLASRVYVVILEERPDEPQSWRDLALSYSAHNEFRKAVLILNESLNKHFERFEMKDILLLDLNRILALAESKGVKLHSIVDSSLIQEIQMDMRAVLTWNADNYNINMTVTEPSGEILAYRGYTSTIGGRLTHDFDSYGPEQYVLKKALRGNYKINLNAGGDRTQEVVGEVICRLDLYTGFGRKDEFVTSHYFTFNKNDFKHSMDVNIGIKEGKKRDGFIPKHIVISPFESQLSIAAKMKSFGFSWDRVKAANPKIDWSALKTGQKIIVPTKN